MYPREAAMIHQSDFQHLMYSDLRFLYEKLGTVLKETFQLQLGS